ncbi:MAG TPA: hypothetical protein VLH09_05175, partial [Bryobacteraceae bacterium]|nr:hypothetical protein [Bryobacteraceae bacterium]
MNRREFLSAGSLVAAPAIGAAQQSPSTRALMKLGTQERTSDEDLRVFSALGVSHICGSVPSRRMDENW